MQTIIGRAVKNGQAIDVVRVNWSSPGAWGITDTNGVDRLLVGSDELVLFMGQDNA